MGCTSSAVDFAFFHSTTRYSRLVPELVAFLSILDDFYPETSGITLSCELVAGLTIFAAMPYILAVNPSILSILTKNSGSESCFMTRRYH